MRALRFTAKEVDYLRSRLTEPSECPKERVSILKKLDAAEGPSTNIAVAPVEQALVAASRMKVVPLVEGHAMASVRAGKLGVTPEKAKLVGEYLARTKWLTGPFTLLDVLNKWATWYSKASATAPPPSVPAGLGGGRETVAPGPARQGPGSEAGRPAPGFGGGRKDPHSDRTETGG